MSTSVVFTGRIVFTNMDVHFLCRFLAAWTTMEANCLWVWSTLSDSGREVCIGCGEYYGWTLSRRCSVLSRNCSRMVTCLQCSQGWKINTKRACTTLPYCCLYGLLPIISFAFCWFLLLFCYLCYMMKLSFLFSVARQCKISHLWG